MAARKKKEKECVRPWRWKGRDITDEDMVGMEAFVYIITHEPTGKRYIGKKNLYGMRKLKPTDKKKTRVESNWRDYFSSSDDLKGLLKAGEKSDWRRDIVYLCEKEKYANYLEVKLQFYYGVLESDDWLNSNINGLWFSHWMKDIRKETLSDDERLKIVRL